MDTMVLRVAARFQVASSLPGMLRMIVEQVLRGRSVERLVEAYNEEAEEDFVEESGESVPGSEREKELWETENLGMLHSMQDIERYLQDVYVKAYTKRVPWADRAQAMEVYDFPNGFPTRGVTKAVVEAVALALAAKDAEDAHALREMALSRQ